MIRPPLGKCRNCEEPVSYFARACPNCLASNLPNPVVVAVALVAVALAGGMIALGIQAVRSGRAPQPPAQADRAPADRPAEAAADYGWIVEAMAECQEEAKIKTDSLHFLIVPVVSTGLSLPGWTPNPISTVGNAAILLSSADAMIGLRNRALALYQKPLTFAVSDPATRTTYKWKPAVGVASLKARDTGSTSLTLGFEIPELSPDIEWGPTINLGKGTCYWINPLVARRAG